MKAILLSAVYGMRLKPLTDNIPKCLLPINNKSLLYHWLNKLEEENISEAIMNTHYLPQNISEAFGQRNIKCSHTNRFLDKFILQN